MTPLTCKLLPLTEAEDAMVVLEEVSPVDSDSSVPSVKDDLTA